MFNTLVFIFNIAMLTSCVSFNAAQTARTLTKGKVAGSLGVSGLRSMQAEHTEKDDTSTVTTRGSDQRLGSFSSLIRYGLEDNFEIQAQGAHGAHLLGAKYQYLDNGDLAGAIGANISYFRYHDANGGRSGNSEQVWLPLYFSYDISKESSIYTVPFFGYLHSRQDGDAEDGTTSKSQGAIFGFVFGQKIGYFLECAAATIQGAEPPKSTYTQINVGLVFGRDNERR